MATNIKMTSAEGVTLYTKNKYVKDDIHVSNGLPRYDGASDVGVSGNEQEDALISGTLTSYSNDRVTKIRSYAFEYCKNLESADLPNVTEIGTGAFSGCSSLKTINIPKLTTPTANMFSNTPIEEIDFPLITNGVSSAFNGMKNLLIAKLEGVGVLNTHFFRDCHLLHTIYIPNWGNTGTSTPFTNCYSLKKIVIEHTNGVTILGPKAFSSCYHILGTQNATYNPNGDKDGYIYVPASLLSKYKVATNWVTYETQIIGHQDFNVGDTLPSYANDTYTTCTWYSDETLTQVVTSVATAGRYYCRLEA